MRQIKPYIGRNLIKVLTGIRRCGKSSILALLRDELRQMGAAENDIVYIDFENMKFSSIDDAGKLYDYVTSMIHGGAARYYLLFDEIQEVSGWERAINSFAKQGNADVYITGSNSRLLSSELATYIAGRYVEIKVKTLSFKEFLAFKESRTGAPCRDIRREFEKFARGGGFPITNTYDCEYEDAYRIVRDIYTSVLLRDTIQRHNIRNIDMLDRIVKYVFDNLGNTFSAKNIADYFKSQRRKLDIDTVYNYLAALESAFVVSRVSRYDIKGREILKTMEKFYVADHSLIYAALGYKDRIISGILENIVMHEIERRGYKAYVGKLGDSEVDFIGERGGERIYVQVAYLVGGSGATFDREFSPLLAIKDNYPKYVLSMDDLCGDGVDGVRHLHIADFLNE